MHKIIFATGNADKMTEIREILADLPFSVTSMKEEGLFPEIEENGSTFAENALIKARALAALLPEREDVLILADDSGLEIDALGGAPGIHSARFMEGSPYPERNRALLDMLQDRTGAERAARFRCVIAAVFPDGRERTVSGTIEGVIAAEPAGSNGFGYDPIFFVPELGCTTAELTEEEKNRISHRGRALEQMKQLLKEENQDEASDRQ